MGTSMARSYTTPSQHGMIHIWEYQTSAEQEETVKGGENFAFLPHKLQGEY